MTKYTLTESEIEKVELNEPIDLTGKEALTHLTEFSTKSILKSGGNQPNLVQIDGDCFIVTYVRKTSYSDIPGQLEESVWEEVLQPTPCPEENSDYSYTLDPNAGGLYIPILNVPNPQPYIPVPGLSGGTSGSGGNKSPYNPVITKPRVLLASPQQCKKVKNALDRENFRQEVVNLAGMVNDPVNEQGVGLNYYNTAVNFPPGPEIEVPVPISTPSFPNGYIVVSHTHNVGKLSVFSFSDFEAIAKLLFKDKINTDTFVATLSTEKGTHYVLTISTPNNFRDFFYHRFNDIANLPQEDQNTYRNRSEKAFNLSEKYYNGEDRLLSEVNANNTEVLKIFLQFLKEADMGVTLFETDAAFQNFEQVSINGKGEIKRSTCN